MIVEYRFSGRCRLLPPNAVFDVLAPRLVREKIPFDPVPMGNGLGNRNAVGIGAFTEVES